MNIFKILAKGDGKIDEANISSFLGYLLDPYQDHGLGFEFLSRFLELLDIVGFIPTKYDYEIFYEQAFRESNEPKNIVDIVILCFESNYGIKKESFVKSRINSKKELRYIFLIENKISAKSIKKSQLKTQFDATKDELGIDEEKIFSIYITPEDEVFKNEFANYENSNKFHFLWYSKRWQNENTMIGLLKKIVEEEAKGDIENLNSYTKTTLISFMHFIINGFKSNLQETKERKNDGSYTQRFRELNEKSRIVDKLQKLADYLLTNNTYVNDKKVKLDLSKPRFPTISIFFGDFTIDIHAGSLSRDRIGFIYRINANNISESRKKLLGLIEKYKMDGLKNANSREAYCRTNEMQNETIILEPSNFELINSKLNDLIKMAI